MAKLINNNDSASTNAAQSFSSLQYEPDPVGLSPKSMPSTHRTTAVGGEFPPRYHTTTHPVSHKLTHQEVGIYRGDPIRMVGKIFLPGDGENLWEVVEVSYGKKKEKTGWSSVVVRIEGNDNLHTIVMEEFLEMFETGVLKGVDY